MLHLLASWLGVDRVPPRARLLLAAGACALFCLLDVAVVRRRRMCSVGIRRQTPKNFVFRFGDYLGSLFWGLDTGLAVTTFRTTALTWASLALLPLHILPWWSGLAYGLGFSLPCVAAILGPRWRPPAPDGWSPEPQWIPKALMRGRHKVQIAAVAILLLTTMLLAITAARPA